MFYLILLMQISNIMRWILEIMLFTAFFLKALIRHMESAEEFRIMLDMRTMELKKECSSMDSGPAMSDIYGGMAVTTLEEDKTI